MSDTSYSLDYPSILLPAERGQSWLARLELSHWLLLAYPVFLHLVARTRAAEDALVVDDSAKYQVIATAVYGIYVFSIVMCNPMSWIQTLFHRPLLWWTLYLILTILSGLWSVQPLLTLFRSGQAIIFFLLAVHAMRCSPSYKDWVKLQLLFGLILILCGTYSFIMQVYPAAGFSVRSLHGWGYPHCLVGILFMGLSLRNRSWRPVLYLILGALMLSTAAKAYIALVVGVWFFLHSRDFSGRNGFLWAVSFVLMVLLLFFPHESLHLFFPGKEMHTIVTGHGRLPVWEAMAEDFVVYRPIQGYGFGVGDKLSYLSEGLGFKISHMHNIFLTAVMNLGIIGGGLIAFFYIDLVLAGWRCLDRRWRASNIAALMAIMFTTLFTTSISSEVSATWLSHALLFVGIARHNQRLE